MKEKGKERQTELINLEEFISIKGEKALGNKLTSKKIKEINLLSPLPYTEPVTEEIVDNKIAPQEIILEEVKEVSTEIELNITNDTSGQDEDKNPDDDNSAGQITLEL